MGKQMGYTGRIGNVIHYKMDDKYYSRSAPRKYKQTKATRAKSLEFGIASTIGRIIRENMGTIIFNKSDRKMQTRLVGEIYEWLQTARNQPASSATKPDLNRFNFSTGSPTLSARWNTKLEVKSPVSGQIQISIPAFVPKTSFNAPPRTTTIVCRIASVVIDVKNKKEIGKAQNEISFIMGNKRVDAQNVIQDLPMPVGSLLVTGMCLEFSVSRRLADMPTMDKLYQPSQIIYADYY